MSLWTLALYTLKGGISKQKLRAGWSNICDTARLYRPPRAVLFHRLRPIPPFLPDQPHFVLDWGGRDDDVPELERHQPYDPFKVDVFTVGNVFLKEVFEKYLGSEFLSELIEFIMTKDPGKRPSSQVALQKWRKIKTGLSTSAARWRLRRPDESVGERVVLDTIAVAKQGIHSITHLFNDNLRTW